MSGGLLGIVKSREGKQPVTAASGVGGPGTAAIDGGVLEGHLRPV